MAHQRPFRFGVLGSNAQSREEWANRAREIEDYGYSTLLMGDHVELGTLPAMIGLMAAADVTSTLRVGTYVLSNDFRHPVLLAKEAAALDLLSDGRLEFGLGAGWLAAEYEQMGISFDPPAVRVGRFKEALSIIKSLLANGSASFNGEYYSVTGIEKLAKSLQRPYPPVMIGGAGKRMLSIAGREADIVAFALSNQENIAKNVGEATSAGFMQKVDWVRQAAGARFSELELNVLIGAVIVTENRQQVVQRFVERLGVSAEQVLEIPFFLIGNVDQICDTLYARREQYGVSYTVILNDSMESFAPVVARLAGK
jgi:probable F420-dependent oxidoreductase